MAPADVLFGLRAYSWAADVLDGRTTVFFANDFEGLSRLMDHIETNSIGQIFTFLN